MTAAGITVARARNTLAAHFLDASAVSPDAAISYEPGRFVERRLLSRLCEAGVVRSTADGRLWLDRHAWHEWNLSRRRRAAVLLLCMAMLVLAVMLKGQ